jgi:drug/metabolite transporter (DMT)-like permease
MGWKQKLSSRKFWVALAGLVVGVIALLGIKTDTSQITGVIMALGSVIAYIFGEGYVDAASAGTPVTINGNPTIAAGQQGTTPPSTSVVDTVDP